MAETACVTGCGRPSPDCAVCQRRPPLRPQVCDGCRARLGRDLAEIAKLHAVLPDLMEPGRAGTQRVSGTREAPLPLRVDVLDLSLPLRGAEAISDPHGDQTGHLPVVAVLDQWARDWRDTRDQGERLPVPTVPELVRWLANRLGWACDQHPAVDEFATEVDQKLTELRGVHGLTRLRHRLPAPCPSCELLAVYRDDGADWIECGGCGRLWSEAEWARLVTVLAGEVAA